MFYSVRVPPLHQGCREHSSQGEIFIVLLIHFDVFKDFWDLAVIHTFSQLQLIY